MKQIMFDGKVSVASAINLVDECDNFCSAKERERCPCDDLYTLDVEAYISESIIIDIWNRLDKLHPDRDIGLTLGKRVNPRAKGILTSWASQACSVGESLNIFINNISLMNASEYWDLKIEGRLCYLTYAITKTKDYPVMAIERSISELLCWVRSLSRHPFILESATFSFDKPKNIEKYEELFGVSLSFGSSSNSLVFPLELLDLPIESGSVLLKGIMEHKALETIDRLSGQATYEVQVKKILEESFDSGEGVPSAVQVASKMYVSRQTLFRRLQSEGTNYTGIVNLFRKYRVKKLLNSTGLSISEVSYRLGFKDVSSFYKAYRRWFGNTPVRHSINVN
ncbi:AraC family transcriptional regulator [Vibrio sp. VB16]|uniref:AraC family transcriptional regulator n=1 Tax=Vibrio sp. VB16 TaxID=2785746 RepID=UPI00189EF7A7|nr:AraC family transcriptional regulator [Vibrio sp. VB16]UGA53673.1 AraC family transcriptional regulator [Vibrio sp. VB16]